MRFEPLSVRPGVRATLESDFGVRDGDLVFHAVRPTVLSLVPSFWGSFRRFVVVHSNGVVQLIKADPHFVSVVKTLETAYLSDLVVQKQMFGRRLKLEFPGARLATVIGSDVPGMLSVLESASEQ